MRNLSFLFDLDHTLCDDHHLEKKVLSDLVQRYCAPGSLDKADFGPLSRFQKGEILLKETLTEIFLSNLRCTITRFDELLEEFQSQAIQKANQLVTSIPGTRELLKDLTRRHIQSAIFSNGWTRLQEAKAHAIRFPGPVATSEEIGAWKPDPAAFIRALKKLGLEKDATFYVGDSPETDIAGAKKVGLRAVWVNFDASAYPPGIEKPDYTIKSLQELVRILEIGKLTS